jgi:hypothetical protein
VRSCSNPQVRLLLFTFDERVNGEKEGSTRFSSLLMILIDHDSR